MRNSIMVDARLVLRHLTRVLVIRDFELAGELVGFLAESCGVGCVDVLLRYARRNGVAHLLYEALVRRGLANTELARALAFYANQTRERGEYRDELLLRVVEVLEGGGIGYVIFKTFNDLGVVDVDVDVLITPEGYWRAVRAFLSRGFKPVDALSKKYATGFMIKGNPIILDLHTDVTVLGAPYVDRDTLLKHRVKARYRTANGDSADIYVLDAVAEALVRVSHAVVKEAEIKIEDISEVMKAVVESPGELRKLAEGEEMIPALQVFLTKVCSELGLRTQGLENVVGLASKTLRGLVSGRGGLPPYRLPRLASIIALSYRVLRRNEAGLVLKMVNSLKYRRNTAHIGSLLVKGLVKRYE